MQPEKPGLTGGTPPVRIVIAGEHSIFRHGLRRLLEAELSFEILGETPDPLELPQLVRDLQPDVLLLPLGTPRSPTMTAVRAIAALGSPVRTLILTDRVDSPEIALALELGVRGVVLTDASPEVLFASIRSVLAGELWLGHEAMTGVETGLRKLETSRRRAKAFGLTRREIEIIRAVVAGYTNREIAERSSISENTVKCHLTHIFNKSGASSRVELALFAAHHRLLDGL
ncbi:MAG TPA: response regulator transcription factor [Vicinamibacterales bacterium]|nr:response regulator transcription factor [Vicinamibacterales bacterium]